MRRYYEYRVATYRREYDGCEIETREDWARKGFVPIQRRKGEVMYTSGWLGQTAEYFYRRDVKEDKVRADAYLAKLRGKRNARRRELARTRKDRLHAKEIEAMKTAMKEEVRASHNNGIWLGYLRPMPYVIVFDTETTGLDPEHNNILSLSWQLLKISFSGGISAQVIEKEDLYFDWPADLSRVTDEAIMVNGLTQERLAKLGTTEKGRAIIRFTAALAKARVAVAHNAGFDTAFIASETAREGILPFKWPRVYDTMTRMTDYCELEWYEGADEYKWPRLEELAECLDVNTDDVIFHYSGSDVEVTKRCFMKIVEKGLDIPF